MNTKIPVTDIQTEMPDDIKEHSLREESRFRGKQLLAKMADINSRTDGGWSMGDQSVKDVLAAYEEARDLGNPDKISALETEADLLRTSLNEQSYKFEKEKQAWSDLIRNWQEKYDALEDEFDKLQDDMEIEIAKSDRLATERRRLVNVVQELVSLIK